MPKIIIILLLLALIFSAQAYAVGITIDATADSTITNFKTDLAKCSCNITDLCDNFCCCDTSCGQQIVSNWTASNWCEETGQSLERYCDNLGKKGFSSFEDLGCVMFSNRGNIGYFYDVVNTDDDISPPSYKFSFKDLNAEPLSIQSLYEQDQLVKFIVGDNPSKSFPIRTNTLGSSCLTQYLNVMEPGSYYYSCSYSIENSDDCLALNNPFINGFQICSDNSCSTKLDVSAVNVPTATFQSGSCKDAVTQWNIEYQLGSSNGNYIITKAKIDHVSETVTKTFTEIKTSIKVTIEGVQNSGNPGYNIGKPIKYQSGGIYDIFTSASDHSCVTVSASPNTTLLDIQFGINRTYTCEISNGNNCAEDYYIDALSKAESYSIKKYGLNNLTDQITIEGEEISTCSKQIITLTILYSSAGWVLDPQYYILSAKISSQSSINALISRKFFTVSWVYVSPEEITTPPTNYFYEYFSYLWFPLKSKYQNFSLNENTKFLGGIMWMLLVLALSY